MNEEVIRDRVKNYFENDLEDTVERLSFLLENFDDSVSFIGPHDVWFCFDEARHSFMVGNFVASISMCAITIERWLAFLLSIPFYDYPDREKQKERSDKDTLGKLNKYAHKIGLLNDSLYESITRLNHLRTNFIHGIDPATHKRPQEEHFTKFSINNPKYYGFVGRPLQKDAEEAIEIMFDFYKEHQYLTQSKFK